MIEKKFLHYETLAGFEADKDSIAEDSIVFVKSNRKIYTHGAEYDCAGYKDAIKQIWEKIEDITGESIHGFNMVIDHKYFTNDDGIDVNISVNTNNFIDAFERITFYKKSENDADWEMILNAENIEKPFTHTVHINVTTEIKCVVIILGVKYEKVDRIDHYKSFWLGAGYNPVDVMILDCIRDTDNSMRGAWDVHVEEGQKIIVVVGKGLTDGFIRADLNSVEIPMTKVNLDTNGNIIPEEDNVTEVKYIGFMSEPWIAGDYNIDVNG